MKTQPTEWEKYLKIINLIDGLISKIYEALIQFNSKMNYRLKK